MTIAAVIAVVVAAGVLTYLVLSLFAKRSSPLDTEKEERWFVLHAPAPLRRFLYFADRRVVGGAALAFIFTVVLVSAAFMGWVFDSIDEDRGFARFDESAAEFGADNRERLERALAGESSRFVDGDSLAELPLPDGRTVAGGDLPGDEELIAGPDARGIEPGRRRHRRQFEAELLQLRLEAHWYSPRRVLTTFSNSSEL